MNANYYIRFKNGHSAVYQIDDITCFQIVSESYAHNLTYTVNKVF